jgi:YD repeat-containing protein
MKVKSGCGTLFGRGQMLDLGVYFRNIPDGLTDDLGMSQVELLAGTKRQFGWQCRLIKDTAGNATIYWGAWGAEGWLTPDGGTTFDSPRGSFGTLTQQPDGSFTRTTKDGMYYDFDSAGRLQTIKDRSANGNVIYYNYDGTPKVTSISGPGMEMTAYFTYDVSGAAIAKLTLQAPNPAENRVTYYNYAAGTQPQPMTSIVGPSGCVDYFAYDGNQNLIRETNPDNFLTYFSYTTNPVPRIREIDLPEGAAMYFTYNDAQAASTTRQLGNPARDYRYNWAGLPEAAGTPGGAETIYFDYQADAKPAWVQGTDGNMSYYQWDADGQAVSQQFCGNRLQYFTYGPLGRVTSRKDELGNTTYWNYDAQGMQRNWIDALGQATYFTRDAFGNLTSKKDRRGNVTYYGYDTFGNHTATQWADGSTRYFDWNAAADLEVVVDELGNATYFDHDSRSRITKWKDFLGQLTQYGYDNRSNKTVVIDRRGNAWYWQYDGQSRNVARRTALGNTTYFNYSPNNLKVNQIDPLGNPTYFYYTDQKRLLATENALKEITYYTYTIAGQVKSVKDPLGCTTYMTYDCRYRKNSMTDGMGNATYYRYDLVGNPIAQTDPRGNTTYFYFDADYRRTALRNPLNELNYYYYDPEADQTSVEDALQRRTYYFFDSRRRNFCIEDALQDRTYFTFDARSYRSRSSQRDPNGNVTYFYQDGLGRQFAIRDARNGVTYIQYDAESDQVASTTPRGLTTYFAYDPDQRQVSRRSPLNEFTYYAYDAAANQSSVSDPRGNSTYFYFDKLNRVFAQADAKGARMYYTFDAGGNQSSIKDPLARVTYLYHDCDHRNFAVLNAADGLRYFTFDQASNRDSVKDERGKVAYFFFDPLNRDFAQRSAVGGVTYFGFDPVGNRVSTKDPVGRLNYFYYDAIHRLTAQEDGLQRRTYYTYDPASNTTSAKNARRATVSPAEVGIQYFTYDQLNRRNSFKDEVSSVWYYDYDADSNLSVQTNPLGARTYWTYDGNERKTSQKDPLSRTWYWTYDAAGNNNSLKDGKAQTTYYQYDVVNLQTRIDYPDGARHTFAYDLARQLTGFIDPSGRTTFEYDDLGRATSRTNPGAVRLYYEYDAASNRTNLKDPDGKLFYYSYDANNRMERVESPDYGGALCYYEYTLADQVVTERRKNSAVTYYQYDNAARVTRIGHHNASAPAAILTLDYQRDEAGNVLLNTEILAVGRNYIYFNYDPANRVVKEAWRKGSGVNVYGFAYDYDAAGNRIQKENVLAGATTYWEYDLADQMTRQRSGTPVSVYFTYDPNGNVSQEHDTDPGAGRTYYDYDPRNLLVRVGFPGAIPVNYFAYNAMAERIRKNDSTGGKKYTWDGLQPVLERDLSNTTTQRLVKGYTPIAGIGEYLLQDVSGSVVYPLKNQVGTTMRQTDGSAAVKNYYEYDGWGQPFEANETVSQQFRFTGKELDPDFVDFNSVSRRYHFPARIYLPFRGIFAQVDPLFIRMFNPDKGLYAYGNGNPLSHVDPDGNLAVRQVGDVEFALPDDPNWEFDYKFRVQYSHTPFSAILAKLTLKYVWVEADDCFRVHSDEYSYQEWFRMNMLGEMPLRARARAGGAEGTGNIDIHGSRGAGLDICYGQVHATIEYGPTNVPAGAFGGFGLANQNQWSNSSGPFGSTSYPATSGVEVTNGLAFTGYTRIWRYDYNFARMDCCCMMLGWDDTVTIQGVDT